MKFIDQLRAEVKLHGDMETEFKSRRYHQAKNIAGKYVDMIEEQARIAARNGDYERLDGTSAISGFIVLNEQDFEKPFVVIEKKKEFLHGKMQEIKLNPENELFEVFLSAFQQLCREEHIICHPFQAQILDKDGHLCYHTLPMILKKPKKRKIQAYGFPYQIEF